MKSGKVALTNFGTWNNGAMITAGMTSKDYGAFIAPSQSGPGSKNYFIEASSLMVAQNSPNRKAAEDTVLAWLKEDAQKEWLKTTLDLPVNPKVTTDDPVLKQVMAQVSTEKPSPLNRYYEAFPPKLVQSTIATLQAFMVTGDNPQGVADTLQKEADTEWAAWDKDPSIG
jgi:multiple sugar transport system substrate-binding protein